jgi:hypothetical protein
MAGGIGIEEWRGEKPLEGLRAVRRGEESSIRAARPPGAAGATGKRPGGGRLRREQRPAERSRKLHHHPYPSGLSLGLFREGAVVVSVNRKDYGGSGSRVFCMLGDADHVVHVIPSSHCPIVLSSPGLSPVNCILALGSMTAK